MSELSRRAIIAALGLAATSAGAFALRPSRRLSDALPKFELERAVPSSFAGWAVDRSIVPVLPSPDVAETIGRIYDQTLGRTYVRPDGTRVMLSLAYGGTQTQKLRAHRQEVCYTAQGFQVSEIHRDDASVRGAHLPLTRMIARMGARTEPVTYWFTMGEHAVMSLWDRQRVQFEYSLRGLVPDGFLVRFSSMDTDSRRAFQAHLGFAEDLLSALPADLAARIVGRKVDQS